MQIHTQRHRDTKMQNDADTHDDTDTNTKIHNNTDADTHKDTEIDTYTHTNPMMQTPQLTSLSLVSHTATESWETGFSLVAFDARWAR